MQLTRHILSIFLIIAVLLSGFPHFMPEDVSHDGGIGLEDAILSVKAFVLLGESPDNFLINIKNTLSTFQINAGLKTVIKQSKDNNSTLYLDLIFLILISCLFVDLYISFYINQNSFLYKSISIPPRIPPPRLYI